MLSQSSNEAEYAQDVGKMQIPAEVAREMVWVVGQLGEEQ